MQTYTVLIYEAERDEGGYWAEVAELPGCMTQGETIDEIRANVLDAIETWFVDRTDDQEPPRHVAGTLAVTA